MQPTSDTSSFKIFLKTSVNVLLKRGTCILLLKIHFCDNDTVQNFTSGVLQRKQINLKNALAD